MTVFSFPKHVILKRCVVEILSKGMTGQSFFNFFGTNWNSTARTNPKYVHDKRLTKPTHTCVANSKCFGVTRFDVTSDALGGFQISSMYKFYGPYERERGLNILMML